MSARIADDNDDRDDGRVPSASAAAIARGAGSSPSLPLLAIGEIIDFAASTTPHEAMATYGAVCHKWREAMRHYQPLWLRLMRRWWPHTQVENGTFDVFLSRIRASRALKPIKPQHTTPIEDCNLAFRCPLLLEQLTLVPDYYDRRGGTSSRGGGERGGRPVYYCNVCGDHVFTVRTQSEKQKMAMQGRCVVFRRADVARTATRRANVALAYREGGRAAAHQAMCRLRAYADDMGFPATASVANAMIVEIVQSHVIVECRIIKSGRHDERANLLTPHHPRRHVDAAESSSSTSPSSHEGKGPPATTEHDNDDADADDTGGIGGRVDGRAQEAAVGSLLKHHSPATSSSRRGERQWRPDVILWCGGGTTLNDGDGDDNDNGATFAAFHARNATIGIHLGMDGCTTTIANDGGRAEMIPLLTTMAAGAGGGRTAAMESTVYFEDEDSESDGDGAHHDHDENDQDPSQRHVAATTTTVGASIYDVPKPWRLVWPMQLLFMRYPLEGGGGAPSSSASWWPSWVVAAAEVAGRGAHGGVMAAAEETHQHEDGIRIVDGSSAEAQAALPVTCIPMAGIGKSLTLPTTSRVPFRVLVPRRRRDGGGATSPRAARLYTVEALFAVMLLHIADRVRSHLGIPSPPPHQKIGIAGHVEPLITTGSFPVVIAVPASCDDRQRQAVRDACSVVESYLTVLRVVNDATMALSAHGIQHITSYSAVHQRPVSTERCALLMHFADSSVHLALYLVEDGVFEMLASTPPAGALELQPLTGRSIDRHILAMCLASRVRRGTIADGGSSPGGSGSQQTVASLVDGNERALRRLSRACQKARRELASNAEAVVSVDALCGEFDLSLPVSRLRVEAAVLATGGRQGGGGAVPTASGGAGGVSSWLWSSSPTGPSPSSSSVTIGALLNRSIATLLATAGGLSKDRIDDVVPVGSNGCIFPTIERMLSSTLFDRMGSQVAQEEQGGGGGGSRPTWRTGGVDPIEAVARGAATMGTILHGTRRSTRPTLPIAEHFSSPQACFALAEEAVTPDRQDFLLGMLDVMPLSISVGLLDGSVAVVIARNSMMPVRKTLTVFARDLPRRRQRPRRRDLPGGTSLPSSSSAAGGDVSRPSSEASSKAGGSVFVADASHPRRGDATVDDGSMGGSLPFCWLQIFEGERARAVDNHLLDEERIARIAVAPLATSGDDRRNGPPPPVLNATMAADHHRASVSLSRGPHEHGGHDDDDDDDDDGNDDCDDGILNDDDVVHLCVDIDANGIVMATATIDRLALSRHLTITSDKGRVSASQIDDVVRQAEVFAAEDEILRRRAAATRQLSLLIDVAHGGAKRCLPRQGRSPDDVEAEACLDMTSSSLATRHRVTGVMDTTMTGCATSTETEEARKSTWEVNEETGMATAAQPPSAVEEELRQVLLEAKEALGRERKGESSEQFALHDLEALVRRLEALCDACGWTDRVCAVTAIAQPSDRDVGVRVEEVD